MAKTNEREMEKLALTMPNWNDYVVEEYRKDPEWMKYRVNSELEEYAKTGDIQYLLSTLKNVAIARGWVELARATGLSRPTLYETLNGKRQPRIDTLTKILNALGFKMLFVAVDNTSKNDTPVTTKPKAKAKAKQKTEKQLQQA